MDDKGGTLPQAGMVAEVADAPRTPWGKRALGVKTRKVKKASSKLIIRRING